MKHNIKIKYMIYEMIN